MTVFIYTYIHVTALYYSGSNKGILCVWEIVVRKLFVPQWEEITVVKIWLHNLYRLLCYCAGWMMQRECVVHILKMLLLTKSYLEKTHGKILLVRLVCRWYDYCKIEVKQLVLRILNGSVWNGMLVAGRICNRLVECMFFVGVEFLDQLMDCGTVTQYCSFLYCVGVWQAKQTWLCSAEGSVLLCCCNMMTGKLARLCWRMQAKNLLKLPVTIKKLTYHISPQQLNCHNTTTVRTCNLT